MGYLTASYLEFFEDWSSFEEEEQWRSKYDVIKNLDNFIELVLNTNKLDTDNLD